MLLIDRPKHLARRCAMAVNQTLGGKPNRATLVFSPPRQLRHGSQLWELGPRERDRESGYRLIPMVSGYASGEYGRPVFSLSASIEFDVEQGGVHLLRSVTLRIHEHSPDGQNAPILRAEWACPDPQSSHKHAQPHWHACPLATDDSAEPSVWERFHFAMAARWHTDGRESHQEAMTPDGLVSWLRGCLEYTIDQLNYIEGRRASDSLAGA